MAEDTGDLSLQGIEIRLCVRQLLLCMSQLGRRDHIHRVGDLHRVLHAVDPALYLSDIRHFITCSP